MNTGRMEQIEHFLDGGLSAEEMEQFCRDVRADAELRAALVSALRLAGLAQAACDAEAWTAEMARVTSILVANDDPQNSFESRVMARCEAAGVEHGRRSTARRRMLFWAPLAAAAALVVAAGGYWMMPAASLGLRVVQASGKWQVASGEGRQRTAAVGMELRRGDRVVVAEGGKAELKYDGEETTLALHSGMAVLDSVKGAKRLKLESGLLVGAVAPQSQPFRMETSHGVAVVVGTRFSLGADSAQTTLAVQDGQVALRQHDKKLDVNAGETAEADASGLRKLSPADAWLRELLVRAETGLWDVVNLGTGVYSQDVWRMDARGGPSDRKIWNVTFEPDRVGIVSFRDGKRWTRGVVTGRIRILPDGQSPMEIGNVPAVTNISWRTYRFRAPGASADLQKLRKAGVCLSYGPAGREGNISSGVVANENLAGVWFRYAVYFDAKTQDGFRSVIAGWPEGATAPPASAWRLECEKGIGGDKVDIGLMAKGVLMEAQGLKFVPLGADMPLPPNELLDKK